MPIPTLPPLNGRNLAEFYVAGEAAKRTALRDYAKPPREQEARIIMYDSIRRVVPEYLGGGRDAKVLASVESFLAGKRFVNEAFDTTFHKWNNVALDNLRQLKLPGEFRDRERKKTSVSVAKLRVLSTTDFFATYVPKSSKFKAVRAAVIVNPSGIKRAEPKRKQWVRIESEVALRAAMENAVKIDEVFYIDLPKGEITRYKGPKQTIWAEIDATCERILRDWRDIRLAESSETGT